MFFRKKKCPVSLAQEFNKACQLKMYTDSQFSNTFLKAASKDEYQQLWDLNIEIGAEEMVVMMESFFGVELDDTNDSTDHKDMPSLILQAADLNAAILIKKFAPKDIKVLIPMGMQNKDVAIEFASRGARNLAKLCLI